MIALIDFDTPCFASAQMAEGMDEQTAIWNVNTALSHLIAQWNISEYKLFVTGSNNFRYKVYPEYKANRLKQPRPQWLEQTKRYAVDTLGAVMSDGCEADDLLGVDQHKYLALDMESVIVSIDKDLDQIEGLHYSPEITRLGKVVKAARRYHVSPNDARRFFYYQLLVGDSTDNIKGAAGIGPKKAEKILEGCSTELEYYNAVKDFFSCEEEIQMNADVLYIWRKENDRWSIPTETTVSQSEG